MRVGLNLLYLVPGETGGRETYARRLIPALRASRPDLELVAFVAKEGAGLFAGEVEAVELAVSGRGRASVTLTEQLWLPRLARRHQLDVLHSLGTTAPRFPGVPSVVTIHDVIYRSHPQAHSRAMLAGMRILVPIAARGAARVIAISEAAATEIEALGMRRDRIDVVPHGGKPAGPATPEPELRQRHALGTGRLVLSVLARRPHKNADGLLEAFARVEHDATLVLPGYATEFEDAIDRRIDALGIRDRVRVLGWVSDEDLEGLYRAATCFVFPSLAEGFGLPVLEALERGLAVACSNTSAMPEVAGDAAVLFDPESPAEIAAAISALLSDAALRGRLISAGRTRAAEFSWEASARGTALSYERAAAGGR